MPSDAPPGQVLSSVSSFSGKRRSSKLGACAEVLFQIFHGKRLFSRQSLPAERPNQAVSNHTDGKLLIAKLLPTSDENSSGPLKDADDKVKVENVAKVECYEEKVDPWRTQSVVVKAESYEEKMDPRRMPSLVARLMGLETMPSSGSEQVERKQFELRKDMDCESSIDSPQPDRQISTAVALRQYSSLSRSKTKVIKRSLPTRFAACQKKKVQGGTAKSEVLAKVPSLPSRHLDASFPSSAKRVFVNKNFMRTQRTPESLEAAPKVLKANLQQNRQTQSQQLQISLSGTKAGSRNSKTQLTNIAAQSPCSSREGVKAARFALRSFRNGMITEKQLVDSQKTQLAQQHVLNKTKCLSQEATLVKRKHGLQCALEKQKTVLKGTSRSDWQRRDETSRRSSQPTVCSTLKSQGSRSSRHPSPPKSLQDSSVGAYVSQAPNCTHSSSRGALSSQLMKSHAGNNNVSARKHSSSSVRECLAKLDNVVNSVDTMQPLESMHDKLADLPYGNTTIFENSDACYCHSAKPENSLRSQFIEDGFNSLDFHKESQQRSSKKSSVSSDPSLLEFTTTPEECSIVLAEEKVAGHEREDKWKDEHTESHHNKRASVVFVESSFESLSPSPTMTSETASSITELEGIAKSVDLAHTYYGRDTAAILQELLTALSYSMTQRNSSFAKKAAGTLSGLLDSETGKPQFLPAGSTCFTEDFCMMLTSQDSATLISSDSSQLSQGNEMCEMDNSVASNGSTSITEMQAEVGYFLESSGTEQIQSQCGLSRDCEALMSTMSKLHRIDREVISLNARTTIDQRVKEAQQLDHSLSSSTCLLSDADVESIHRLDIESDFRSEYDEVAGLDKKLVTDCINEAFRSLSEQMYKFCSSLPDLPSATHVLSSRVYKQLDEWRGNATSMNLDDMVEKEMNLTTRNWRHIVIQADKLAEVVESTIFSGLLEEVLLELI